MHRLTRGCDAVVPCQKRAVPSFALCQDEEHAFRRRRKEVEIEATKAEMGIRSMEHLTSKMQRTAAINKQIYRVDET